MLPKVVFGCKHKWHCDSKAREANFKVFLFFSFPFSFLGNRETGFTREPLEAGPHSLSPAPRRPVQVQIQGGMGEKHQVFLTKKKANFTVKVERLINSFSGLLSASVILHVFGHYYNPSMYPTIRAQTRSLYHIEACCYSDLGSHECIHIQMKSHIPSSNNSKSNVR